MDQIDDLIEMTDKEAINKAIVLLKGIGQFAFPVRDENRIIEHFGSKHAVALIKIANHIYGEMYVVPIDWNIYDLSSATDYVVGLSKAKYSFLDQAALASLDWSYAFDNK